MSKKYHVFISSTFDDLRNERKSIMAELWKNGYVPVGMERFSASSRKQWNVIKEALDECDYMVLILGGRYGTIDPITGISYTEREYNYAKEKGIPVIPFIRKNIGNLPLSKIDTDLHKKRNLEDLIKRIKYGQEYESWTNSNNLAIKVLSAINKEIINVPRPGYSRNVVSPFEFSITHDALCLYEDIQKSQRFIILHAAYYPKYLEDRNSHQSSIGEALRKFETLEVYIILTDFDSLWISEFGEVLRTRFKNDIEQLKHAIESNVAVAKEWKDLYPDRVHLYKSRALPFTPIVIADNLIAVGHYEHSSIPAPEGLWIKIRNRNIVSLTERLLSKESAMEYEMDAKTKAVFRYIEDCVHAIQTGTEIQ